MFFEVRHESGELAASFFNGDGSRFIDAVRHTFGQTARMLGPLGSFNARGIPNVGSGGFAEIPALGRGFFSVLRVS